MPCTTCRRGCGCPLDGPGCGHYGCYGRGPVDCPGASAEQRRYDAILAQTRREARRRRVRRVQLAATYQRLVGAVAYGVPGSL
jgi:hypothetical protein